MSETDSPRRDPLFPFGQALGDRKPAPNEGTGRFRAGLRGGLLLSGCEPLFTLGRLDEMTERAEGSQDAFRAAGDRTGEGRALNNAGAGLEHKGDYEGALQRYGEALAAARETGNRVGEERTLSNIGVVHWLQNDHNAAHRRFAEALAIARDTGDRRGEGGLLGNIGVYHLERQEHSAALRRFGEALAIARETGDRFGEGLMLMNAGLVRKETGDREGALELLGEALAVLREAGYSEGVSEIERVIARFEKEAGMPAAKDGAADDKA